MKQKKRKQGQTKREKQPDKNCNEEERTENERVSQDVSTITQNCIHMS